MKFTPKQIHLKIIVADHRTHASRAFFITPTKPRKLLRCSFITPMPRKLLHCYERASLRISLVSHTLGFSASDFSRKNQGPPAKLPIQTTSASKHLKWTPDQACRLRWVPLSLSEAYSAAAILLCRPVVVS